MSIKFTKEEKKRFKEEADKRFHDAIIARDERNKKYDLPYGANIDYDDNNLLKYNVYVDQKQYFITHCKHCKERFKNIQHLPGEIAQDDYISHVINSKYHKQVINERLQIELINVLKNIEAKI